MQGARIKVVRPRRRIVSYLLLLALALFTLFSLHRYVQASKQSLIQSTNEFNLLADAAAAAAASRASALQPITTAPVLDKRQEEESSFIEQILPTFSRRALTSSSLSAHLHASYPKIFCMVPTQLHAKGLFPTILDTWGRWCDKIIFTVDPPVYCEPGMEEFQPEETVEIVRGNVHPQFEGEMVYLNKLVRVKGNLCYGGGHGQVRCRHIWEKVWRSWVYVSDHYADEYDYFFKVDDDTFFFVPAMREAILERGWSAGDHHYFGHRSFVAVQGRGIINGALVGFSRMTLRSVVEREYKKMDHEYGDRSKFKHKRCVDRDGATEEVTTSICVGKLGVEPEALYDAAIPPRRAQVLIWPVRDMLTFSKLNNRSELSWFYKGAPPDLGSQLDCCSYRPAAFHFLRTSAMQLRVYDLLMDPQRKNELERVVREDVPVQVENAAIKAKCSLLQDGRMLLQGTCAEEARYMLKVKQVWHARDPSWYAPRLASAMRHPLSA